MPSHSYGSPTFFIRHLAFLGTTQPGSGHHHHHQQEFNHWTDNEVVKILPASDFSNHNNTVIHLSRPYPLYLHPIGSNPRIFPIHPFHTKHHEGATATRRQLSPSPSEATHSRHSRNRQTSLGVVIASLPKHIPLQLDYLTHKGSQASLTRVSTTARPSAFIANLNRPVLE